MKAHGRYGTANGSQVATGRTLLVAGLVGQLAVDSRADLGYLPSAIYALALCPCPCDKALVSVLVLRHNKFFNGMKDAVPN